jgi:hypothetical protein
MIYYYGTGGGGCTFRSKYNEAPEVILRLIFIVRSDPG